ncbi:hypothetical protein AB9E35_14450 [Rhizobium leguminosarum]
MSVVSVSALRRRRRH